MLIGRLVRKIQQEFAVSAMDCQCNETVFKTAVKASGNKFVNAVANDAGWAG